MIYKVNAPRRIRVVRIGEKQILKGGKPRKGAIPENLLASAWSHKELYPRICVPWRQGNTRLQAPLCSRRRRSKRIVMPQVLVNPRNWPPSEGPWLWEEGSQRQANIKWKWVYWKTDALFQNQSAGLLEGWEHPQGMGLGSFYVLDHFILEWVRGIFYIWGKGWGFSEIEPWLTFVFFGHPWNCHGVRYSDFQYYNKGIALDRRIVWSYLGSSMGTKKSKETKANLHLCLFPQHLCLFLKKPSFCCSSATWTPSN